jgi:cytochrome d ubiquinol oxidase subunit I
VLESPGLRRNDETLHQAARFWARVFSINFIMGVLTGTPVNAARFDGGDVPFHRWG